MQKRLDFWARLSGSLSVTDKIVAAVAIASIPSAILWAHAAQYRQAEIDRLEQERGGVSQLRFIAAAGEDTERFLRAGATARDIRFTESARTFLGVVEDNVAADPWLGSLAADAIAAVEALERTPGGDAQIAQNVHDRLDLLARNVTEASGLEFDAEPGVRHANVVREDHLPELAEHHANLKHLVLERAAPRDILRALDATNAALLDLESLARPDARAPLAPALAAQIERVRVAFSALSARLRASNGRVASVNNELRRALTDAEAALATLQRESLNAADQALETRIAALEGARTLDLGLGALFIGLFISLGVFFARRTVISPLNHLMETTAALSTGQTDHEISQQERQDEIGAIARYLAASNEFVKSRIEAEAARRSAERDNAAKSSFITTMTHELRTPLNAIIGYGELLLEDAEAANSPDASDLSRLLGAARHLLQLISDVLDLSVLDSGDFSLRRDMVSVRDLLEECTDQVRDVAHGNGTALSLACPADMAPFAADRTRLRQCVMKLLSNAAKFTKGGDIRIRAEEYRRDHQRALRIIVSDTGIGIKPSQLKRLFDPFLQGRDGLTREHGGMGVGLAVTQRLAQAMGGDVSVQSEFGKGSSFTLWITEQAAAGLSLQVDAQPVRERRTA